jgi:XRE family transcriptional regulator, regulator of sulfur utilization
MSEKEEFLLNFGAHLRKLRKEKGISLREFELRGDIDRHMLSRIENGQTNPTLNSLRLICEVLDTDLKTLFNEFDHN